MATFLASWRCRRCHVVNGPFAQCSNCSAPRPSTDNLKVQYMHSAPAETGDPASPTSPVSPTEAPAAIPSQMYESDLPMNWQRAYDAWGRVYYVNHVTQKSQWDRPVEERPPSGPFALLRKASTKLFVVAPPSYQAAIEEGADPERGARAQQAVIDEEQPAAQEAAPPAVFDGLAAPEDVAPAGSRSLANLRARSFRVERDIDGGCFRTKITDTITRNKALTVFFVVQWGLVGPFIHFYVQSGFDSAALGLFISALVWFGLYWAIFIIPSGCSPLCMYCCTISSSPCMGDYVVEAIQAEPSTDSSTALAYMQRLQTLAPVLTLHVVCSHTRTTGSGKNRRTERIVTYRGSQAIDLAAARDLSMPPIQFANAMTADSSSYGFVSYDYEWETSDEGRAYIKVHKQNYYEANRHRDRDTSVSLSYAVGDATRKIDVIVKDEGCRYYVANLFINRWCLFLFMYAGLYLPYLCFWKCLMRPFRYANIKYVVPRS